MFDWLKRRDPRQQVKKRNESAIREARDIQRRGDIIGFAAKMAEAEAIGAELDAFDRAPPSTPRA